MMATRIASLAPYTHRKFLVLCGVLVVLEQAQVAAIAGGVVAPRPMDAQAELACHIVAACSPVVASVRMNDEAIRVGRARQVTLRERSLRAVTRPRCEHGFAADFAAEGLGNGAEGCAHSCPPLCHGLRVMRAILPL